jgi:Flp pilus assembly protein TadB
MASGTQGQRLDRIEEKIDKLAEAMISLARAEEKLISIEKSNYTHFERMNRFSAKLDDVEKKTDDNSKTIAIINKLFWTVLVAAVTVITAMMINLN